MHAFVLSPRRAVLRCLLVSICALPALAVGGARAASVFIIRGGGNGHGIGLSQYGAYGYAVHGKSYQWILAHYYRGTALGTVSPTRTVRVLLSIGAASFSGASAADGHALKPGTTYSATVTSGGQIQLTDGAGHTAGRFTPPLVVTAAGTGLLDFGGLGQYRGSFTFRASSTSGGVETVNDVPLDSYVRGVVAAEMPSSWAAQALDAQSVAARTYAITAGSAGADFDVYRDTRSQMYGGVAAETASTDAAVATTSGQVVTYNGVPVVTYFFSSSGGHTESIQNVWQGSTPEPWLRGVTDPYDGVAGDPYHRWGSTVSVAAAGRRLSGLYSGRFVGIQVTRRGLSPRVLTAKVVGTRGSTTVTGDQLQRIFGLLTTYMQFTTITTSGAAVASVVPATITGGGGGVGLGPGAGGTTGGTTGGTGGAGGLAVKGSVFPAPSGAALKIQLRSGGRFVTVTTARTGQGGTYTVSVSSAGTYRVLYNGFAGPAVSVS